LTVPIEKGGSGAISNIQPLCQACSSLRVEDIKDYRIIFCQAKGKQMLDKWQAKGSKENKRKLNKKIEKENIEGEMPAHCIKSKSDALITKVWEYYRSKIFNGSGNYKLNDDRRQLIEKRIGEGRTWEEFQTAIDNFAEDDFEKRDQYNDVVYCMGIRNHEDKFEKYLHQGKNHKPAPVRATNQLPGLGYDGYVFVKGLEILLNQGNIDKDVYKTRNCWFIENWLRKAEQGEISAEEVNSKMEAIYGKEWGSWRELAETGRQNSVAL
jgi:hypothetical protein